MIVPVGAGRPAALRDGEAGLVVLAAAALATYLAIGLAGDLRSRPVPYLAAQAALAAVMLLGWVRVRRLGARGVRIAIVAAVLFRLAAAVGPPSMSDDVYRYVWDGRVQLAGIQPYRFAPDAPELAPLRDADWGRINHRGLTTIYPPLAEAVFACLAALGAGAFGFKLALGLFDVAVALALTRLLRASGRPADRVVLYAWNPLAVVETAGSGHVEPIGVALAVLAVAWLVEGRRTRSAVALAGAVGAKLLPLAIVPSWVRRVAPRHLAAALLAGAAIAAPYALSGPLGGNGLLAYAGRWEANAPLFPAVRAAAARLDTAARLKPVVAALERRFGAGPVWRAAYRAVWPETVARAVVAATALAWLLALAARRDLAPADGALLALGGVLLLSPTVHPWYVLWVLPFAAAAASPGWLWLAAAVPLAYLARGGSVPWSIRAAEYLPVLAGVAIEARAALLRRSRRLVA